MIKTWRRIRWFLRFARRQDIEKAPAVALAYAKLLVLEKVAPSWQRPLSLAGLKVHHTDVATLRWLYKEIFIDRDYEPPSSLHVDRIVDAGGNIGLATLFFRQCYPEAEILTFEPDPRAFACLQQNLRANAVTGVVARNVGLGAENRDVTLYVDPHIQNSCQSMSPSFAANLLDGERPHELTVRIAPLTDFTKGPIDVLKLDVEGFELAVLRGAAEVLPCTRRIYMEYHKVPEAPLHDVLGLLAAAGHDYEIRGRLGPGLGAVTTLHSFLPEERVMVAVTPPV
jgi:FkbM family methyltransferase